MADADEPSLPHFETLSTSRAPDDGVIDYWREARRHAYVDVSTDPADPDFYGDVRLGRYTNFTLSTKRATAEQTHRNRSRIAQGREQDEYLFATFQTRGSCVIEQAGHTAVVPPGSIPWVEPEDISNAVLWLASNEARYVTGVVLPVDGGLTAPFKLPHEA